MTQTISPTRRAYLEGEVEWQDRHITTMERYLADPYTTPEQGMKYQEFLDSCTTYRARCQEELDELDALTR